MPDTIPHAMRYAMLGDSDAPAGLLPSRRPLRTRSGAWHRGYLLGVSGESMGELHRRVVPFYLLHGLGRLDAKASIP
jgi:hypothetical protein